jgi:site-specific recombinase XerD
VEILTALESWDLDLKSSRRSDRTRETYGLAIRQLADYLKQIPDHPVSDIEAVERDHIRRFIGMVLETRSPATAKQRHASLHHFFAWLVAEGELESHPMDNLKPPKVPERPVEVVSERAFELLLKTCSEDAGRGQVMIARRDEAILRVLWDTGVRVGELLSMRSEDISLDRETVWVDGKTGVRQVPYTMATARSLDRWHRARSHHRLAHRSDLWLGMRGDKPMTRSGIRRMLDRRSEMAQIGHIHPHMFRHSAADRLLSAGLSEGSVMELLGWTDRAMLDRYGRSVRHRRAIDDYRKMIG